MFLASLFVFSSKYIYDNCILVDHVLNRQTIGENIYFRNERIVLLILLPFPPSFFPVLSPLVAVMK